jgi:protein-L-isoaspartate(D-aspartate) O-methyltransferase
MYYKNNMEKEDLLRKVKITLDWFAQSDSDKAKIQRIIDAMSIVDRKFFVEFSPYEDTALPIGYSQTISQPSTVARMLMLLDVQEGKEILEIGAGSGWNASLLGFLAYPGKVLSLDVVADLIDNAKENLRKLKENLPPQNIKRLKNIRFKSTNIFKNIDSWKEKYDRIIITAGIEWSQEQLIRQLAYKLLKEKGKLVCPYQRGPMMIFDKQTNSLKKEMTSEEYAFVPLRTGL